MQVSIWNRQTGFNYSDTLVGDRYEVVYLIAKPEYYGLQWSPYAHGRRVDHRAGTRQPAPGAVPVGVGRRCIASTDARMVLDAFMGSGTTAVAAQIEGRDWTGIELSEAYADMARQRIARARGEKPDSAMQPELFEKPA